MTMHLGNVDANSTLYIPFSTYAGSTGASVTLTGLAVTDIEIYKNGSVTQRASDAGYTLLDTDGIDFDGITGIHGFSIDLSDNTDAGFYSAGAFYWVVVSAVTVDSQTVNFIAATFRIGPAAANVTQFGGTAGTFASGRPEVNTTHVAGTSQTAGDIIGDTNDIQNRLPAALVGGRMDASVGAMAANVMTAAAAAADLTTELQSGLATASALSSVATEVSAILDDTGTSGVVVASGSKTGYALTSAYDFAKGTVAMTEAYAADGAAAMPAEILHMIWSLLAEKSISTTTLTAKKLDGSTTAMTFTLNDASSPTSITRAS